MSDAEEHEYELTLPFVVCESEGGPYRDDDFVAGFVCGTIDTLLITRPLIYEQTVRPEVLPLLDLIAMRHGYTFRSAAITDGWYAVYFELSEARV